jgi:hypothetical protein
MKNRTPEDTAKILAAIYEESFGGKDRGRYRLTHSQFRRLSGRKRLEPSVTTRIVNAALEEGFVIIDLGDHFCIVEESVMLNYRPVPKNIGLKYIPPESAGQGDSTDEDE